MTTVLVVVNKKKEDLFRETYEEMLIKFNEADIEAWTKKTRIGLQAEIFEKTQKEEEDKAKKAAEEEQTEGDEKKEPKMPTNEQINDLVAPLLEEELTGALNMHKGSIKYKPGVVPKSLIDL